MRNAFAHTLLEYARQNSDLLLLTADLGFSVFEDFEAELPAQYLNTGCAEANTAGMAAGLALSGKKIFIYSIVPFITMRCFEQIRVDICYHNLDVTVVGVGGGLAYGQLGPTHHSIEDIALMRSLPNMKVVCPGDPIEARLATQALLKAGGPSYLRLNRGGDPVMHDPANPPDFRLGKALKLREGKDIALITTSAMLGSTLEVADRLAAQGISAAVFQMHTVKPLDEAAVLEAARNARAMVTIEEHSIIGGLGSAVAEILCEHAPHVPLKRLGIRDRFTKEVGRQDHLRHVNGLDVETIVKTITKSLEAV